MKLTGVMWCHLCLANRMADAGVSLLAAIFSDNGNSSFLLLLTSIGGLAPATAMISPPLKLYAGGLVGATLAKPVFIMASELPVLLTSRCPVTTR